MRGVRSKPTKVNLTAPADAKVTVTPVEVCDPMLTPEDQLALKAQEGLTLEGVITRNWNT